MHDPERDQPTAANDGRILQKLPNIIAALAPEYPKFVEKKMASNPDEIRDGYRDQRRQKPTEREHHGKVDQCYGTSDSTKANKS